MPSKTALVFRHVPHEGLGTLAPALRKAGLSPRHADVWRSQKPFPAPSSIAALIIMGGPMGVYEKNRYPFLKKELSYIKKAVSAGKPVLGVCLGAQLIAHALGARVYPNDEREIGWYPLQLTAAGRKDPLMAHLPQKPVVFQWHGDTFDLPRGATLLATSPLCRNQAFRLGKNVYALQFHVEVDGPMIREWLSQPSTPAELSPWGPGRARVIRAGIGRHQKRLRRLAAPFFKKFAALVPLQKL